MTRQSTIKTSEGRHHGVDWGGHAHPTFARGCSRDWGKTGERWRGLVRLGAWLTGHLLLLLIWRARQATTYMRGQRCPKEMRNSTRLWIRRDPSLPRDSLQPFYWLGHHSSAAVVAHSWRIVDRCQTMMLTDVDKMSSCSRFSDSVVGFTGQKTQPTASKYWRKPVTSFDAVKFFVSYIHIIQQWWQKKTNKNDKS